jgi:1,4-alpha-glucan branching enzyme
MNDISQDVLEAIASGDHADPFAVLGPHQDSKKGWVIRTFQPRALEVELVDGAGKVLAPMKRVHSAGVFEASLKKKPDAYRLRLKEDWGERAIEDPYRFPPLLGEVDRHLMGEGTHLRLYEKLGAHPVEVEGVPGVYFGVWAPNARRVSVVGPFNHWDGRCHPMRLHHSNGVWEIFIPGLEPGQLSKYES